MVLGSAERQIQAEEKGPTAIFSSMLSMNTDSKCVQKLFSMTETQCHLAKQEGYDVFKDFSVLLGIKTNIVTSHLSHSTFERCDTLFKKQDGAMGLCIMVNSTD